MWKMVLVKPKTPCIYKPTTNLPGIQIIVNYGESLVLMKVIHPPVN